MFGLMDYVLGRGEKAQFCSKEFPQMWGSFIDSFADYGFNGAPCSPHPPTQAPAELPTVVPAAERLIAIGDLHGDLPKARRAFRLAGLTDEQDRWSGGTTVCVQVGDVLDRGDHEVQILYFLERLQKEAEAAGGKLYLLNGNHETMNIMGDHRYATAGATREVQRWQRWQSLAARWKEQCNCSSTNGPADAASQGQQKAYPSELPPALAAMQASGVPGSQRISRTFAMQPGSPLARRFFANHPTVLQVGSTVFVHGGVLPGHVEYGLERINKETQEWMRGESGGQRGPAFLRGASAVVWARNFSAEDEARCDCEQLQEVLQAIPGAQRMVMGHTIQDQGVNSVCEGRALRIDVGMSRGCGNHDVEVLEIMKDSQIHRLREGMPPEDLSHQRGSGSSTGAGDADLGTWGRFVQRIRGATAAAADSGSSHGSGVRAA